MLKTFAYNVEVAKLFGINSASMISLIASKKGNSSEVALDRVEIYNSIGLDADTQLKVEGSLRECGVLTARPFKRNINKNYYTLDPNRVVALLDDAEAKKVMDSSTTPAPPKSKTFTKKQKTILELKRMCISDDPAISQYLIDWIDSIYQKPGGFITTQGLNLCLKQLFSLDKQTQCEVLKIAIKGGYRDIEWAINIFNTNKEKTQSPSLANYSSIKFNGEYETEEEF